MCEIVGNGTTHHYEPIETVKTSGQLWKYEGEMQTLEASLDSANDQINELTKKLDMVKWKAQFINDCGRVTCPVCLDNITIVQALLKQIASEK
jgi:hypothetical protein